MTILWIVIAVWLVLGLIGSPVVFIQQAYRVDGRITVGDVISALLAILLGPLVFCMAVSLWNIWEVVIYKKEQGK